LTLDYLKEISLKKKLLIPLIASSFISGSLGLNIAHGAALPFVDGFENRSLDKWRHSGMRATLANSPTRSGNYAVQFSIDRNKGKNAYRSELAIKKGKGQFKMGQEYWIGASIFIPNNWVEDSNYGDIVLQWHGVPDAHLGEGWSGRNPPLALRVQGKNWQFQNYSDPNPVSRNRNYKGKAYNLGSYQKGQWADFVFHIRWSYQNDGILEVWKNGKKMVSQNGPNTFNDRVAPYLKIGLYKPAWKSKANWANKSHVNTRTVYHDEIWIK
jgi:hypothetical protein